MRTLVRAFAVAASLGMTLAGQPKTAQPLCNAVVGLLATDFIFKAPNSELPRVEIRQCTATQSATLQIVAWRNRQSSASLVINTDDFGVVFAFARANVFVIETGGATRDQVFVITYQNGQPKLVLRQVTKGRADIRVDAKSVTVEIVGIYAGDSPERVESHRFLLVPEATMPAKQ